MTETFYGQLDEFLDPVSRWRYWLRFPENLEKHYETHHDDVRRRENVVTAAIACLLFDFFLVSDYLLNPANIWRCIVIRLFIFTPLAVTAIGLIHFWRARYVNYVACVVGIAMTACCALCLYFGQSSTISVIAQGGLLVIMGLGTLILRLSLPFAVLASAVMVGEDAIFLYCDQWLNRGEKVTSFFLVGAFALLSVVARFRTECLERRYFVLFLKENQSRRKFALLNENLADLSTHDRLTGLYNRRHFDSYVQKVWELARRQKDSVSIAMVDIDRFKELNDSRGHLFGDAVLAAVANILRASTRGGEDSVVRYGGDEFVIVLPGTNLNDACVTTERICRKVREVGNSLSSDAPLLITVSCGVASGFPSQMRDPLVLLAHADKELYRAKELGRNRVCCATHSVATETQQ